MPTPIEHSAAVTLLMRRRFGLAAGGITRSPEYRAGCQAALERATSGQTVMCPHLPGSSAYDAFWAGVDEGARLWQREGALVVAELNAPTTFQPLPTADDPMPPRRRMEDHAVPLWNEPV